MSAAGPRAVLLGWGNARPAQLRPYERLHRELGLEPRVVIPSVARGLFDPRTAVRALEPLADELAAERGERPWYAHVFSDNGFVALAALLATLGCSEDGVAAIGALRGLVFDSSPGLWASRGALDFARRFALGLTPSLARALGLGARARLPLATPALTALFLVYRAAFRAPVRAMLGACALVERAPLACPMLFLYGERDELVTPADVRAFAARQRARGLAVDEQLFPGAHHVALLPADPRAYRERVARFVAPR